MVSDNRFAAPPVEAPPSTLSPLQIANGAVEATSDFLDASPDAHKSAMIRFFFSFSPEQRVIEVVPVETGRNIAATFIDLCNIYDRTEIFIHHATKPQVEMPEHHPPNLVTPGQLQEARERLSAISSRRDRIGRIIQASLHADAIIGHSRDAQHLINRLYQLDSGRPTFTSIQERLRELLESPWQAPDNSYLIPQLPPEEDHTSATNPWDHSASQPSTQGNDLTPPTALAETPNLHHIAWTAFILSIRGLLDRIHTPHLLHKK